MEVIRLRRPLLLRGGVVRDPLTGVDEPGECLIVGGRIQAVGPPESLAASGAEVMELPGRWIVPGFWDLHVHLREPGDEESETVASGQAAALRGGFTAVTAMPNTNPVNDRPEVTARILAAAQASGWPVTVFPVGALTRGSAGEEPADYEALVAAGARAFSDDGRPVPSARVLAECLRRLARLDRPALLHCEDLKLSKGGVMHAGEVARRLGVAGMDRAAEDRMVARDLELAGKTGARVHICHLSTRGAVTALHRAKAAGWRVTGEVTPHHLLLTHEAVPALGALGKMNPPLREEADREALVLALRDGVVDAVATDHAPHAPARKMVGFVAAPFGVIGLESAFPVLYTGLVRPGWLPAWRLLAALTAAPAAVLGIRRPGLRPGAEADLTVLSVAEPWVLGPEHLASRSRNCPFLGWEVWGRVEWVLRGEKLVRVAEPRGG